MGSHRDPTPRLRNLSVAATAPLVWVSAPLLLTILLAPAVLLLLPPGLLLVHLLRVHLLLRHLRWALLPRRDARRELPRGLLRALVVKINLALCIVALHPVGMNRWWTRSLGRPRCRGGHGHRGGLLELRLLVHHRLLRSHLLRRNLLRHHLLLDHELVVLQLRARGLPRSVLLGLALVALVHPAHGDLEQLWVHVAGRLLLLLLARRRAAFVEIEHLLHLRLRGLHGNRRATQFQAHPGDVVV
mmetsp:Transcript_106912/g.289746  ORF Transcript_106912/g.289746 Transcript_106912/m.289746 type:complete len:244 (-) Transcript_106912:347-1078(-)